MQEVVRTAVIPAGGLGTRFLPASKSQPKEMLAVVDKPAIQYVAEEAVRAGIDDLVVVTSRGKGSLEDHFDRSEELEARLAADGKASELEEVRALAAMASFHFVRQGEPKGLGHAVALARHHVGRAPFAVLLPDDLLMGAVLERMLDAHRRHGASVLALREVQPEEVSSYGCARVEELEPGLVRVLGLVEKPRPEAAPSRLAIMGRYVLQPDVFDALEQVPPGAGGEIQLTDAVAQLLGDHAVLGVIVTEERYDVGSKLDYLRATVELGLSHPELGGAFREVLTRIVSREGISSDGAVAPDLPRAGG